MNKYDIIFAPVITEKSEKMKEQGILKRVGSDRNGYWKVLL